MASITQVLKDAKDVYDAAKQLEKDKKGEAKTARKEIASLEKLASDLLEATTALPSSSTVEERGALVDAAIALVQSRAQSLAYPEDIEEIAKLKAQEATLQSQKSKLLLLAVFAPSELVSAESLARLRERVEDVQEQIGKAIRARGYVRIATRTAILAIDLALLVAKAAA